VTPRLRTLQTNNLIKPHTKKFQVLFAVPADVQQTIFRAETDSKIRLIMGY
jgi:hypothetical protein